MPPQRSNQHRLLVGVTGSGKTTGMRQLVERSKANVFVWDRENEFSHLPTLKSFHELKQPKFAFRFYKPDAKWLNVCLEYFMQAQEKNGGRPLDFFIDEAIDEAVCKKHFVSLALKDTIIRGRKRGVSLTLGTQYAFEVGPTLRANMNEIYLYNPGGEKNATRFGEELGIDKNDLRKLKVGEFYLYKLGGHDIIKSSNNAL